MHLEPFIKTQKMHFDPVPVAHVCLYRGGMSPDVSFNWGSEPEFPRGTSGAERPAQVRARPRYVTVTELSTEKPTENTSGSQLLDYLNVISLPLNVRCDHWLHFSISFATNVSSPTEPSSDEFGIQSIYILLARHEFYSRGKIFFIRFCHVSQLF